jgi:hypothetical protein
MLALLTKKLMALLSLVILGGALLASTAPPIGASDAGTVESGRLVAIAVPPGMGTTGRLVTVNPQTGAYTTIADLPQFDATSGIWAWDPWHHKLYVQKINSDSHSLRTFDTLTGAFQDVPLESQLLTLVYEFTTQRLIALTGPSVMEAPKRLITVDPQTGTLTTIADYERFDVTSGIFTLDPFAHRLYVQLIGGQQMRSIDTLTGAFADVPIESQFLTLVYEATTDRLVGLTGPSVMEAPKRLITVDRATGDFTTIANLEPFDVTSGIFTLDPFAHRLYVQLIGGQQMRSIDTLTGAFADVPIEPQLWVLVYEQPVATVYLPLVKR